jgi:predicted phosphodiesterase
MMRTSINTVRASQRAVIFETVSMLPTHFPSILFSNWQSAVAKIARGLDPASGILSRQPMDFNDPRISAAAAVAGADQLAPLAAAIDLTSPLYQAAQTALTLAKALVSGTAEEIQLAKAEFARDGTKDPFWGECILEFIEHYTVAKHSSVPYTQYVNISDFVLPQNALPEICKIAVIGDWGTGEARAQRLLEEVAKSQPDILLHLGDIYYACTSSEANSFYENCLKTFPGLAADPARPRLFTLCGNHDMYSGAAPYYALLARLKQPASFFCLRNKDWQILAGDTGYNDFDPLTKGVDATWIRDFDEGDSYSELAWHKDKLVNAGSRKTILLTHHQLFTRNAFIEHRDPRPTKKPINDYLHKQFGDFLPEIALWLWGHEHNQVIYDPFAGLQRGRCIGASAIPVPVDIDLTVPSPDLEGQAVPPLKFGAQSLQPEKHSDLYQLGYAILSFNGPMLTADYRQFDTSTGVSTSMYTETL